MKRRTFLRIAASSAAVGAGGLGMARRVGTAAPPAVQSEGVTLQRYEAMVPDTLDLAERAGLAVNALTGAADPEHGYETFQCAHFHQRPAYMSRRYSGPCMQKPLEALPMMRAASGSAQNADYDAKMVDFVVRNIDQDGLWWMRAEGRPWQAKTLGGDQVWPVAQARLISAMLAWHKYDHDEKWLRIAERLTGGLQKIALRANGRAWFHTVYTGAGWTGHPQPSEDPKPGAPVKVKATPEEPPATAWYDVGLPLRGFSEWYAVSGDKKALETAHQLARFALKDSMWGGSQRRRQGVWGGHYHTITMGLMGILEYGIAAQDADVLQLVRKAYENGLSSGIPRIGFFEAVRGHNTIVFDEGCAVSDMLRIAIRLSEIGVGDYWEHVDQYVRNHLVEHQLIRRDLLEATVAAGTPRKIDPLTDETNNVIERNIGAFSSAADPTWLYAWWTMCCNANCAVGLYKGWESIIRCAGGVAQVNLLLNRASPWLDVDSYLPYEGKVVLKNKTASKAQVRIPSQAAKAAVTCRVNGKALEPKWQGQYLVIEGLAPKDEITIEFPMVETEEQHTQSVVNQEYACRFRYNTLVDISPRGERPRMKRMRSDDGASFDTHTGHPMYQRACYQQDKTPLKNKSRYASPVII